jgi:hypothetical protein
MRRPVLLVELSAEFSNVLTDVLGLGGLENVGGARNWIHRLDGTFAIGGPHAAREIQQLLKFLVDVGEHVVGIGVA